MSKKIKVFCIDDSPVYRNILKEIVESDKDLEYMGYAANGLIALKKLEVISPDVITLDIEMPELNGIDTLKEIMKKKPVPVIMVSAFTKKGAEITLQALELGAVDYIQKPEDHELTENINILRNELISKIKLYSSFKFENDKFIDEKVEDGLPIVGGLPSYDVPKFRSKPFKIIAIGSSTGGTVALSTILPKIYSKIGVPIVIVQHMPQLYTKSFAERLNSICQLTVVEAKDGDKLEPNTVYIAPGGYQMGVRGDRIFIEDSEPVNNHKPSVDFLFKTVRDSFGDSALAIILTGMGSDGAKGIAMIKDAGGFTVSQDEQTSVVFGMPGSAIKTGKIDRIIPLDKIANFINEIIEYTSI